MTRFLLSLMILGSVVFAEPFDRVQAGFLVNRLSVEAGQLGNIARMTYGNSSISAEKNLVSRTRSMATQANQLRNNYRSNYDRMTFSMFSSLFRNMLSQFRSVENSIQNIRNLNGNVSSEYRQVSITIQELNSFTSSGSSGTGTGFVTQARRLSSEFRDETENFFQVASANLAGNNDSQRGKQEFFKLVQDADTFYRNVYAQGDRLTDSALDRFFERPYSQYQYASRFLNGFVSNNSVLSALNRLQSVMTQIQNLSNGGGISTPTGGAKFSGVQWVRISDTPTRTYRITGRIAGDPSICGMTVALNQRNHEILSQRISSGGSFGFDVPLDPTYGGHQNFWLHVYDCSRRLLNSYQNNLP